MAGVVLETVSNRKLIAFGITLLLLQVAAYLLGGLIAPAPASTITTLATKCVERNRSSTKWLVPWPNASRCDSIQSFDLAEDIARIEKEQISANDIVFAFKFPLPRDGAELHMSRWFQSIIGILQVDSEFSDNMGTSLAEGVDMKLDVRLGYRSALGDDDHWTEIARSEEIRQLRCNASEAKDRIPMMCDFLPMFELGSCHYDFYLVNIRLPINAEQDYNFNTGIGHIMDLWLTIIHWNGGFNKVWFSLKTVFFPLVVGALVWHCKRVSEQLRPPTLLERTLVSLGVAMSVLNAPIEWLTLFIDMPYMSLIGDIRQGLFYSVLLCFWVIFAGEHMMDQVERNKVTWYWKHLTAVGFACICLFVFEMCEKGVQLTNPFYSIWATPVGTKLALTFVVLAGFAACVYFFFLCYMLFRVFRNINAKKSALPHMNQRRRKFFINVIYRFKFLIVLTAVCAALTVIFFIIGQVSDSEHKWGEPNHLQYRSAFLTGVYAMWNLYVFGLLVLYAPSNKRFLADDADEGPNNSDEQVQLSSVPSDAPLAAVPSEVSALASFVQKASTD